MGVEIERRFLLSAQTMRGRPGGVPMEQGYIAYDEGTAVRVRLADGRAWLTVKGPSVGARRVEVEMEVPVEEARDLLSLCRGRVVRKTRWRIPVGDHVWDVDVFAGDNAGLAIAEVELTREDEPFERPAWIGEEITADGRYANAALAVTPWTRWDAG